MELQLFGTGFTVNAFDVLSPQAHHTGVMSVVPADSVVIVFHDIVATVSFELVYHVGCVEQLFVIVTFVHCVTDISLSVNVHVAKSTVQTVFVYVPSSTQSVHVLCSLVHVFQYETVDNS